MCYLLLLLGAVILGIQTTILDLKLNVEVQKESFVPNMDACIVTCDFECPKIKIHKRVRINRYTFNTPC